MQKPSPHIAATILPDKEKLEIAGAYMLRKAESLQEPDQGRVAEVHITAASCIAFVLICLKGEDDDAV